MSLRALGLAATLAVLTGCGAQDWKAADARLNEAAQAARAAGYAPLAGPHNTFGAFRDSGVTVWQIRLDGGRSYFAAGGCTVGCSSLDFTVTGPADLSAPDSSGGAAPRLEFAAAETGVYEFQVTYGACRTDGCRWVLQVYGR